MEKLLLAVKADRTERALLLQDNDPRVLLSLLRNPRLTVDEVARLAKSSFLTYQVADVIIKTTQWMSNLDVRLGLIHNAENPSRLRAAHPADAPRVRGPFHRPRRNEHGAEDGGAAAAAGTLIRRLRR